MKLLWGLALIALLSLGYGAWRDHEASGWHDDAIAARAGWAAQKTVTDSVLKDNRRLSGFIDSATSVANRYRDTPRPPKPLPPDTTLRDSLRYAVERYTVAEQDAVYAHLEAQTLRGALDSAQAAIVRLRATSRILEARGDSLASLLTRLPSRCPKIPILGISVPKVGIGYAVTPRGAGPAVAVIIPLGCS